jgi:hypothetical protein
MAQHHLDDIEQIKGDLAGLKMLWKVEPAQVREFIKS